MSKYNSSYTKRILDIILSLGLLLFTSPLLLIAMIAIKLESKGPIFFIQPRTGQFEKEFNMIKLRGMVDNAESLGPELTQVDDPRLTKVGKILRRTSIDEVPQVFNVLKGEMSFVGPRPEIPSITQRFSQHERKVFKYKPGITGISQINGRQTLTPEQRCDMEIEYYENATLVKDIMVVLKTPYIVISNEGNL